MNNKQRLEQIQKLKQTHEEIIKEHEQLVIEGILSQEDFEALRDSLNTFDEASDLTVQRIHKLLK